MTASLANKWILITGASSGFGAATARLFASRGARLLLGARRVDRLEAVAAECRKQGAMEAHVHPLDVSKTASVDAFIAWATGLIRKPNGSVHYLDILINNAGGAKGMDPVSAGKDEDWEFMFQVNVLGLLRMTRAALPLMLGNPGGCIINIGSIAGHTAYEGAAVYSAAKSAERKITQTLRLELNGTGLRVGSVDPGFAETEFAMVRFKGDKARAAKVYEGMTPLTAEDIAETILWMASRPPHVNIDEVLIKPTDQAAMHKICRKTAK